jgi:hypothetical protein
MMHNHVAGLMATQDKEHLQKEIDKQMDIRGKVVEEWDKGMLEVNLSDLNNTSGEKEQYWLIVISTARETYQLNCSNRSGG